MCGYFCIRFIDFMLKVKTLLKYADILFSYEYKKNGRMILEYFQ